MKGEVEVSIVAAVLSVCRYFVEHDPAKRYIRKLNRGLVLVSPVAGDGMAAIPPVGRSVSIHRMKP